MHDTPTDTRFFCRACSQGDCYGHVEEFLNRDGKVQRCLCPDSPAQPHHGKPRPQHRRRSTDKG